jgi:hypothetical protein
LKGAKTVRRRQRRGCVHKTTILESGRQYAQFPLIYQTEVEFVALYEDQPLFAEVD